MSGEKDFKTQKGKTMFEDILTLSRIKVIDEVISNYDITEFLKMLKNSPSSKCKKMDLDSIVKIKQQWSDLADAVSQAIENGDDTVDQLFDQQFEIREKYFPHEIPLVSCPDDLKRYEIYVDIVAVLYKEYLLAGNLREPLELNVDKTASFIYIHTKFPVRIKKNFDYLLIVKLLKKVNEYITGNDCSFEQRYMNYQIDNHIFTCDIKIPVRVLR